MGEFIGHLHPALVHLPIGMIIIALIYEWWNKTESVMMWGAAFIGALLAMGTGIVLLKSGYFEGLNMFLHMIMGYLTVIITGLLFYFKKKDKRFFNAQNVALKGALIAIIMIGGHMGGELSHGENYLPNPLKKSTPMKAEVAAAESVVVYSDIIQPIFELKCNRCHEDGDARGRLNMQTREGLLSDKFGDPAIAPGDLSNSGVYKRMTLHPWEYKYMPPSGPDLSYAEKRIITWWISSGASFDKDLEALSPPDDIKALLKSEYGIDLKAQSFYEKGDIGPADPDIINGLIEEGFNVNPLSANTHFLDVNTIGKSKQLSSAQLIKLKELKDHITWLDLSGTDLNDEMTTVLSSLTNLTKLKVQNTAVSDATVDQIVDLKALSVVNLYNTKVSDQSIDKLMTMNELEQIFIWKTAISKDGINRLKEGRPDLKIMGGANI